MESGTVWMMCGRGLDAGRFGGSAAQAVAPEKIEWVDTRFVPRDALPPPRFRTVAERGEENA